MSDLPPELIVLIEVHQSGIHWMEPRELHIDSIADTENTRLGDGSKDGDFIVVRADAYCEPVSVSIDRRELRRRCLVEESRQGRF